MKSQTKERPSNASVASRFWFGGFISQQTNHFFPVLYKLKHWNGEKENVLSTNELKNRWNLFSVTTPDADKGLQKTEKVNKRLVIE